jgi:leucyl/phenylalanyl-tRNA--protein transferase
LFDTQFLTPHLASLGAIEIPKADYKCRLAEAIQGEADFSLPNIPTPQELIQAIAQTS